MNPQAQFCPNVRCHASGRTGGRNIVIHSRKQQRYKCTCCGKTFSETRGTSLYRLKKSSELVTLVVTLLVHGCPVQAIVAAYGLDVRTVRKWLQRAGAHSQAVHDHLVGQHPLDLGQVQGDEIKVKTQAGSVWLAMAVMVATRLWLGGVVSTRRDLPLIQRLVNQVRALALERPLLWAVDGYVSYVRAIRTAFRTPRHTGRRGRPWMIAWAEVAIVQVVKHRHPWSVERRIVQGTEQLLAHLLHLTQGGGTINTAYIERLNATFRQRLSCLARRTRALARTAQTVETGMWLLGCVYNLCTVHETLGTTPAIAAGLTDHLWTVHDLLFYKLPTTYQPPRRPGRRPKIVCSCGFV
jgi:transposase-like protein